VLRVTNQTPQPDSLHPDRTQPTFWSHRFGSTHPSGVNVTRVDGSVSSVSFNVNATLWLHFGQINDGIPLTGEL
jgi:prepilin-type processing-associated H-X9-DG protein